MGRQRSLIEQAEKAHDAEQADSDRRAHARALFHAAGLPGQMEALSEDGVDDQVSLGLLPGEWSVQGPLADFGRPADFLMIRATIPSMTPKERGRSRDHGQPRPDLGRSGTTVQDVNHRHPFSTRARRSRWPAAEASPYGWRPRMFGSAPAAASASEAPEQRCNKVSKCARQRQGPGCSAEGRSRPSGRRAFGHGRRRRPGLEMPKEPPWDSGPVEVQLRLLGTDHRRWPNAPAKRDQR